jgi:glycosyltransferase involved in cell wall biosynthesis
MAAGLAVVTTDVVGASIDLVRQGENGLLVSPRSVPSLEKALRRLTSPGVIDEMKAASPRMLASWRKWADPVENVRAAVDHFIPLK